MRRRLLAVLPVLAGMVGAQHVRADGVPQLYGPGQTPNAYAGQLQITPFATGLSYPTSMQEYGDGILVGTTNGPFYSSAIGKLWLLRDTNHDGVAEPEAAIDLTPTAGLSGSITAVTQAGNLVFVTSSVGNATPVINVLRKGTTVEKPFVMLGTIGITFPNSAQNDIWSHKTYALAVRPTPNQSGAYDLLFNAGSQFNDTPSVDVPTASTSGDGISAGFANTSLQPESIYKTTVTDNGTKAAFSAPVLIAKGLRNAAGIAFQPGTGDLYFQDNGIDGSSKHPPANDQFGNIAYSLDTLHKISAADIGVNVVDYGFTQNFNENDAAQTKHGEPSKVVAFARLNNLQLEESEGANQIAFAPSAFPGGSITEFSSAFTGNSTRRAIRMSTMAPAMRNTRSSFTI